MVLPSDIATPMRAMLANGGMSGGGGDMTHNWHIQSLDPSTFANIIDKNHTVIAKAFAKSYRNGMRMNMG